MSDEDEDRLQGGLLAILIVVATGICSAIAYGLYWLAMVIAAMSKYG